jgi:hypothetical protein
VSSLKTHETLSQNCFYKTRQKASSAARECIGYTLIILMDSNNVPAKLLISTNLSDCSVLCSSLGSYENIRPIPAAARSKAWVCGRSLAEIASSNPARGIDVCLFYSVCVVR